MKLKEIENLFNEIDYFKTLNNREDYYQEFIFMYGDRDLISKVENLYTEQGVGAIGQLFNLKTAKWFELFSLVKSITDLGNTETTVLTTGSKINKGNSNRQTNSNNTNEVVPFDVDDTVQNGKDINTVEEVSTNTDDLEISNKTVYSGFNKDRIDYFIKKFKNYSEYRYLIYKDITDMLTLQIY